MPCSLHYLWERRPASGPEAIPEIGKLFSDLSIEIKTRICFLEERPPGWRWWLRAAPKEFSWACFLDVPPSPLSFSPLKPELTGLNPYVCDFGYPINQRLRAVFSQL